MSGALSLGLLMYGVSEGPIRHWSSSIVQAAIAVGAILLLALVLVELRKRQPLIDLRLLGNRLFRSANGVMVLASASFIGTLYVVSLFFQDGRGMSALASGLSTFPEALGVMAGAQLASRVLYPVLGPRRNIALGLLGVTASIGLMSLVGAQTSLWWMRLLMFCLGVAMGQVFVPAQAAAFATVSPEATGRASTMFNVIRQLGSAVGVAVFTTVIVAAGTTKTAAGRPAADLAAYHAAFLVAAALAAVGAAVALTIHDADAASTMVRRGSRKTRQGGRAAAGLARQRPPGALTRLPTARHVLARRPGRQPGEVPARERCVQRLGHELIKRRHTSSLAQTPCRTPKPPPPWSQPPPGEKMGLWQETQTTRRGSSLLPGRPLRPRWQSGGSRWRQRPLKRGASSIRPSAPRWRPGALRLPGTGVPVVAHAARHTPMTGACATAARS